MNKMFQMSRTFLTVGDELYEVVRSYNETSVPDVDLWKNWLGAEKVFRKDGRLFFCNLIEEAQIEEITENKN